MGCRSIYGRSAPLFRVLAFVESNRRAILANLSSRPRLMDLVMGAPFERRTNSPVRGRIRMALALIVREKLKIKRPIAPPHAFPLSGSGESTTKGNNDNAQRHQANAFR
jgi:hypothetical protein